MTYFDPRPKKNPEDFYDREEELEQLARAVESSPLTLVLGLRRYGKTSLIHTCLNKMKAKYLYLDCRLLPSRTLSLNDVLSLLGSAVRDFIKQHGPLKDKVIELLKSVKSVKVGLGFELTFAQRAPKPEAIVEVLEALSRLDRIVVVIDEAQELRRLARYRMDSLIAYIYDNLENVSLIISGSQVGLLYKFLRINDPSAPLYGRPRAEVKLNKLPPWRAEEFLRTGFKQHGVKPPEKLIERAVEALDGVIGWLTYLGFKAVTTGNYTEKLVEEVLEEASKLALQELENFLQLRPLARKRYIETLKAIALHPKPTWTTIHSYLQVRLGRTPKTALANILRNLQDAGFIEKHGNTYTIPDPALRHALTTTNP